MENTYLQVTEKETCMLVKKIDLQDYTKYYITLDLNHCTSMDEIYEKYAELYQYISENRLQMVYEKCHGVLSNRSYIVSWREDLKKQLHIELPPFNYIQGTPVSGGLISSIVINAVHAHDESKLCKYYSVDGENKGTIVQSGETSWLYLFGIAGQESQTRDEEYASLFEQTDMMLKNNGFTSNEIFRTWIYLNDINNEYGDLCKARKEYFNEQGIGFDQSAKTLPASTCIGGKSSDTLTCSMDVISVKNQEAKRVYTSMLNEAEGNSYLHQPTFSRALIMENKEFLEFQLSGTASVSENGDTLYLDDPYNQIKRTLQNIKSMLDQYDLTFSDFYQTTCYLKKREYYQILIQVMDELNISHFCSTFIENDICRDNFLVEIDGVLLKKR